MKTACGVNERLEDLGFAGKLLDDLMVLVKTESDLEEFEAYVMNSSHRNMLSIVSGYRKHMIENKGMSLAGFIDRYMMAGTISEKKQVIDELTNSSNEIRWVDDLQEKLHNKQVTLESFYNVNKAEPTLHIRRKIAQAVYDSSEGMMAV